MTRNNRSTLIRKKDFQITMVIINTLIQNTKEINIPNMGISKLPKDVRKKIPLQVTKQWYFDSLQRRTARGKYEISYDETNFMSMTEQNKDCGIGKPDNHPSSPKKRKENNLL